MIKNFYDNKSKLQEKSAFKVYAKSQGLDFATTNKITSILADYEKDVIAHSSDDDDEHELNIYSYIPEEYHKMYDESKIYQGIIDSCSPHACGHILSNMSLSEEFGVMKIKDDIVCLVEGSVADKWGYVKNDILSVSVWGLISKVFDRIQQPILSVRDLLEKTKFDTKVWDIYAKGCTMEINQMAQDASKLAIMKYIPTNISEVTAFTAAIRPSFKSLLGNFTKRLPFEYGVKTLDTLLQKKDFPYSYILYQEDIMKVLQHAGIPSTNSYDVIKAISKKKLKVINDAKSTFNEGFKKALMSDDDSVTEDKAILATEQAWGIIESASRYGFNASHAICVAIDSLYGAYLKANYPIEFYEVCLEFYSSENKDADKVAKLTHEMRLFFDIKMGELKYGNDNRQYTADKEKNMIYPSLKGVKYINEEVKEYLYFMGNRQLPTETDFPTLYPFLKYKLNKRHMETLIKIDYFKDFSKQVKLLTYMDYVENIFDKKQYRKEQIPPNMISFLTKHSNRQTDKTIYITEEEAPILHADLFSILPNIETSIIGKVKNEVELLGEVRSQLPDGCTVGVAGARVKNKPCFLFKSWKNAKEVWINLDSNTLMPNRDDVVMLYNIESYEQNRRTNYHADIEIIKEA